tara:strand:+ start:6878 stop:7099 length:222 start_codon:yes stop_codon:yes gene_type:complete
MLMTTAKYSLPRRPIDSTNEKIEELKVIIKNQSKTQQEMLVMITEINASLKDLKDFKEKQIIEAEKARQGWIF